MKGVIVLDDPDSDPAAIAIELGATEVSLSDLDGRPLADRTGSPLVPDVTIDGVRLSFVFANVAPTTAQLVVGGVDARFTTPLLLPRTLLAGENADLGELRWRALGPGPGSIDGVVELQGASGASRSVTLFQLRDGVQEQVGTPIPTSADGAFAFHGLHAGNYAVTASLTDFTPAFRSDVALNGTSGFSSTFAGQDALQLFPVSAVLLPQLDRLDGNYYTRADSVPLAVLAFGGVTSMRMQAAACTAPAPACGSIAFVNDYVPHNALADVALPDVEGRIGVFAQFEAASPGGFTFESPPFAVTVIRDVTPPVIDALGVPGATAPVVVQGNTLGVQLDALDDNGIRGVAIVVTEAGAPEPSIDALSFDDVTTTEGLVRLTRTATIPAFDGNYRVHAWVRDRAGNVSESASLDVVRDDTPADELPLVVDDEQPLAGDRVQLVVGFAFDALADAHPPVEVQVAIGALPADTTLGRVAFEPGLQLPLTTTAHDGETLLVQARLFDEIGRVSEVQTTHFVTLRGAIAGTIDAEQLGPAPARAGSIVIVLDAAGGERGRASTDADGAYRIASIPEGPASVAIARPGFRSATRALAFVEAGTTTTVDDKLLAQRGTIVGTARKADHASEASGHAGIGITARLISPNRETIARQTVTGDDGAFALDFVPSTLPGEGWQVVANARDYASVTIDGVFVVDNGIAVVTPTPPVVTPLLLQATSGDFSLCAVGDAARECAPLSFTNASTLRVHLHSDVDVTRIRAAADALPSDATLPLQSYDANHELVVALPDRQGSIPVVVEIERAGARSVIGPIAVFRDTIAPHAPQLRLSRGPDARRDGFTNRTSVVATVALDATDADEVARESPLSRAPTFFADTAPSTPAAAPGGGATSCVDGVACVLALPAVGGVVAERGYDAWSFACDAAGNCSATPAQAQVIFDVTPPSALHGLAFAPTLSSGELVPSGTDAYLTSRAAFSVDVDIGVARTGDGRVVVDASGADVPDVDAVALGLVDALDVGSATALPDDVDGNGRVTIEGLPLLGGAGRYDVFARFVDEAGNATTIEPNAFRFALTLDESAPTATLVVAGGASLVRDRVVAVRLDNLSEPAFVKFAQDGNACASDAGYLATGSAPTSVTLADVDGSQLVVACLQDDVGNRSFSTAFVTLDRAAPSGNVTLNGGATFTATRSITATLTNVSADVVRSKLVLRRSPSTTTDCSIASGYTVFASSAALSIGIGEASGTFIVDACFEDAAGNRSAIAQSASILFDATPPDVSIVLDDGADFTAHTQVKATIAASDPDSASLTFTSMRFANTSPVFSGAGEAFATTRTGLLLAAPSTEDVKTICVEVTDEFGRAVSACDDITLDLTPPAGTIVVSNFVLASPVDVTLRSNDARIASAAVGENIDCASTTYTALARNVDSIRAVSFADATTSGNRTITACFRDLAGQTTQVARTVTFDPTDPPLATTVAPATGALVRNRRPSFNWSAVTGAQRYTLVIRQGNNVVLNQQGISSLSFVPPSNLPEGALEWIVRAEMPSGRISAADFTQATTLTVDATPPTAASSLTLTVDGTRTLLTASPCPPGASCTNDNTPTLAFTAGSDAISSSLSHVVEVAQASDSTFGSPLVSQVRTSGAPLDLGAPLVDGNYRVRVRTRDEAGNEAISSSIEVDIDTTSPSAPTFQPVRTPVSSALSGDISVAWTNEGDSGAVKYRFALSLADGTTLEDTTLTGASTTTRSVKSKLVAGDAVEHFVRVFSIDSLGNSSPPAIARFVNDTTPPCSVSKQLSLRGTDAANLFTNTPVVVAEISCAAAAGNANDAPARMQVGCNNDAASQPIIAFASAATCVLNGGDGSKTANAIIFDEAGNPTSAFTDSITVDRVVPTTPVLGTADTVTSNTSFPVSIALLGSDANLLRHEFLDGDAVRDFTAVASSPGDLIPLTLLGEFAHFVRVRAVDRAGNVSPEATVRITLDKTNPTTPVILGGGGARFVNADNFTFSLSTPSTDLNFSHYATCSGSGCTATPPTFVRDAGQGTFTFVLPQNVTTRFGVVGVDAAGRTSTPAFVDVTEDSTPPAPAFLEPPAPVTIGATDGPIPLTGASKQLYGTFTSGPYADVFIARASSANPAALDAAFDHWEVRATHPAFGGFVPMCETATPLCAVNPVAVSGFQIETSRHLIRFGSTIVGFRVPLVPGNNDIEVRAVDKAGNVGLAGNASTTLQADVVATNSADVEEEPTMVGDTLYFRNATTNRMKARNAGLDHLFGTIDDVEVSLPDIPINFAQRNVAASSSGVAFVAASKSIVVAFDGIGADGIAGTSDDVNLETTSDTNPVGTPTLVDTTRSMMEPSLWRDRVAWVEAAGDLSTTQIFVRDGRGALELGDAFDPNVSAPPTSTSDAITRIQDAAPVKMFPTIFGDTLVYLRCPVQNRNVCRTNANLQLVIDTVGPDGFFGTNDDVITVMSRATGIEGNVPPTLFAPKASGRARARTAVAYAGDTAHKGAFVVGAGADGVFDGSETPVQVATTDGPASPGIMFRVELSDDMLLASDSTNSATGSRNTIILAGRDGSLTSTADNIEIEGTVKDVFATLHGGVVVGIETSPRTDVVMRTLASERDIWQRTEGHSGPNLLDIEADRRAIAFDGGTIYEMRSHTLRASAQITSAVEGDVQDGRYAYALFAGTQTVRVRTEGDDGVFGTADDADVSPAIAPSSSTSIDAGRFASVAFERDFALDGDLIAFATPLTDSTNQPRVQFAGRNGRFEVGGDDCQTTISVSDGRFANQSVSNHHVAFDSCSAGFCNDATQGLFVADLPAISANACAPASATLILPLATTSVIDGRRLVTVRDGFPAADLLLIEPGVDGAFATLNDNSTRALTKVPRFSESPDLSGDRVMWMDTRFGASRAAEMDLADDAVRTVSVDGSGETTISVDGNVAVFLRRDANDSTVQYVAMHYFGVEPDDPFDMPQADPARLACPADDNLEENDSILTARTLNVGATVNAIACAPDLDNNGTRDADHDVYRVATGTSQCRIVRAQIGFDPLNGVVTGTLRDSGGAAIGSAVTTSGLVTLSFTSNASQNVFIDVSAAGDTEDAYDVGVDVLPCP